jgi:hypothetical protein
MLLNKPPHPMLPPHDAANKHSYDRWRAQWIVATLACSLDAGVLNPKVSRTASLSAALSTDLPAYR